MSDAGWALGDGVGASGDGVSALGDGVSASDVGIGGADVRGRRVRAAQPACPAASWSRGRTSPPRTTTCARPSGSEARAVVVKLDADGALPPEMYADIRREYLATGPPDASKRDGYDRIPEAAIARVEERRRTTRGCASAMATTEED